MSLQDQILRPLVNAIDEPVLIVERQIVRIANEAARALIGATIEGSDVRLAIRHPQALDFLRAGQDGEIDFTGLGGIARTWTLSVRRVDQSTLCLRLLDRSEAQAAEKMRVDFVANASHELRTPLTAVLGYAESLEDEDLERELVVSFGATIRNEARRMLRIIEDLMSLSRIEADRYVAPIDEVSIGDVVHSSVENVRALAHKRNCELRVELHDELPPVRGDYPQLVQLVDNLLSNALRYGCRTDGNVVRVSAIRDNSAVHIEVSDNGPGIPREHLPFVTRRFYRVDEARSRNSGGTGLGLAIVKHIVERHRGTLAIESNAGEGTAVTVRLPSDR